MNIEIENLQKLISPLPFPSTVILDTAKTVKHWFLTYKYFVIREDFTFENLPFKTCFNEVGNMSFKSFAEDKVLESIRTYWNTDFTIERIEIIAWCSEIVEKDSALFYIYDNQNICKGLYCHSLNWVKDIVPVGNGLGDFYDLEKALAEPASLIQIDKNYLIPRKKISKVKNQTYIDFLSKDEYLILDAEVGCTPTFDYYKTYIDTILIPLTKNELQYTDLHLVSDLNGELNFIWKIDNKSLTFILNNSSDYIDEEFYKKINEVLAKIKTSKLLILFRHYDFGQEYGLAYLEAKKAKKLSELFNIELM